MNTLKQLQETFKMLCKENCRCDESYTSRKLTMGNQK